MVAAVLEKAPPEAWGPSERVTPIRKPEGFTPAVQRWSFQLPGQAMRVAFFGVQGPDEGALNESGFLGWVLKSLADHPNGPSVYDNARYTDNAGQLTYVTTAYWVDEERWDSWSSDPTATAWWEAPERLSGPVGSWREILHVPAERQESIYWIDYPAGLMRSSDVSVYPTPYCGYYGAMRDRLPLSASDPLDSPVEKLSPAPNRDSRGQRWRVHPPANLAVIRSANTWGRMDAEQRADYEQKLRVPLYTGMDYLDQNAVPTGCASLRMLTTTGTDWSLEPEQHALGYFLSLRHMESWAEGHSTHAAIFKAAITRYKQYGSTNQLRTWHEVFVLPEHGHLFEYTNCHPTTGLLPWFDAEQIA